MPTNCTIALSNEVREKLQRMKIIENETYDHLINRIIDDMFHMEKQLQKKRGKNKKLAV